MQDQPRQPRRRRQLYPDLDFVPSSRLIAELFRRNDHGLILLYKNHLPKTGAGELEFHHKCRQGDCEHLITFVANALAKSVNSMAPGSSWAPDRESFTDKVL